MITTTNHDEHYARGLAVCQGEEMEDGRVAHYDDATQTWWAVSRRAVAELGRRMETDPDAYSEWCADTAAEELEPVRVDVVPPLKRETQRGEEWLRGEYDGLEADNMSSSPAVAHHVMPWQVQGLLDTHGRWARVWDGYCR
jgi:hypothetical protein